MSLLIREKKIPKLDIKPGEVVALVGENGSGKTTLVKLLCRLYDPTQGKISLEKISLAKFDTNALRHELSVIFQDFVQYHLTVNETISDSEIWIWHPQIRGPYGARLAMPVLIKSSNLFPKGIKQFWENFSRTGLSSVSVSGR